MEEAEAHQEVVVLLEAPLVVVLEDLEDLMVVAEVQVVLMLLEQLDLLGW
jgi:hypothetical protein